MKEPESVWDYPRPPGLERIDYHIPPGDVRRKLLKPGKRRYVCEWKGQPHPGSFYGGWITAEIRGPFKGGP